MKKQRKSLKETFKPYAFTKDTKWTQELISLSSDKPLPFSLYPESFLVSDALDQLIEYVMRDFVLSWYRSFTSDTVFPSQVDHTLRLAFSQIINRSSRINWPDLIVTKMVPVLTEHFRKFTAADSAVREKSMGKNLTDNSEFQYAVALQYSQGRLHPALQPLKHYQYDSYRKNWLRDLTSKLILVLIGDTATSTVVNSLASDILACSIFFPTLTMLSDPDFWNQLVITMAGPTLQDRKKVEQLRKALNEHATLGSRSGFKNLSSASSSAYAILNSDAGQNDFDHFFKDIQKCKSIPEARKIRYYISSQLDRIPKDATNENYIKLLNQAQYSVDKRIKKLVGVGKKSSRFNEDSSQTYGHGGLLNHDPRKDYNLLEILNDPAYRQSFTEFMDLSKQSLLVQFWLTMNGLRNPLEEDDDDDEDDTKDIFSNINSNSQITGNSFSGSPSSSFLSSNNGISEIKDNAGTMGILISENDIYQIFNTYFSGKMPCISKEAQKAVQNFVEAPKKSHELISLARRALIHTQNAVFKELQDVYLVNYRKSDVFLNFLASDRKQAAEKATTTAESTIDSLQMESISDYEEPVNKPNEKDVEDIEKVFDSIMGNKFTGPSRSNTSSLNEVFLGNNLKSSSKISGLVEDKRVKRNSGAPLPLFEDSESEMYSDMDTADETGDEHEEKPTSELHLAAPGDLGLTEAINMLTKQIKVLYRQEQVLEPLLQKAELTNNVGNLRVLRKSKASLEREIQRKELQRQQYIVQESENSLYGRSNIQIQSHMTARDSNGPFILYVIEVERLDFNGNISAGWVVARRYSQFFQLHQLLRSIFPQVRNLEFPKKRVVLKFQQKSFADVRRIALQKYLRDLLQMPDVCRSKAFRMFLSSETFSIDSVKDYVPKSSKEGTAAAALAATGGKRDSAFYLDEYESDGDEDIYDDTEMSSSGLIGGYNNAGVPFTQDSGFPTLALEAEAEMEDPSHKPFIQPICDFFIQIFGFDRGNNWVRGRAVVVVVQQILGGTIERKLREAIVGNLASEKNFTDGIQRLLDAMWPNGISFMAAQASKAESQPERTGAEKMKCKHDSRVIVHTLIRDTCMKIVGSTSSKYASYHLFEMFQHEKLNAHLVYSLLDVLIDELFPEV
ncbi:uncharacterized protein SAPINGB_P002760 [Magnusiomyces paraingens]|uniref:PX domain-containing protein n=1 Tax=Magnusiomyces paraingens TaxID=2606893 RepID=A0A5E8BHS5_9ASCO|nr:uncharacterized protein SAPINGB_P002760 [Saprochaete ingens]VVT50432.1 unnamed protein product [Saprochaete ingens]